MSCKEVVPTSKEHYEKCKSIVHFSVDAPGPDTYGKLTFTSKPSGTYVMGSGSSLSVANSGSGCVGGNYSFNYVNNSEWFGTDKYASYEGSFSIGNNVSYCDININVGFGTSLNVVCN